MPSSGDIQAFGDSFTGYPPSGASVGTLGYLQKLVARYGKVHLNRGQGSTGYYTAINNCHNSLPTPCNDVMTILVGYNDVKVFLTDAKGVQYGLSGIRAMLANQFLSSGVPASDGSATRTGTWTAGPSTGSKGVKLGGTSMQSSIIGDKISFTFSGDNIVIGVRNSDGIALTYGSVTIKIDGVTNQTYDANNKAYNVTTSGGAIWDAIVISGLSEGLHTVELELTASTTFIVDYFGQLRDPALCAPVIIYDIQHDNTGTSGRNDAMDNMSAQVRAMINSVFAAYKAAKKIAFAPTMSFYNVANTVVDEVHPNDLGHEQLFRCGERVIIG